MVFPGAANLLELVRLLVRRPRFGEAPVGQDGEHFERHGIPILTLVREQPGLLRALAAHLERAVPGRIPHVLVEFGDDRYSPAEQDRVAVVRWLTAMSEGLGSGQNARSGRIRFDRFSLAVWLLELELPGKADADKDLLTALRERGVRRRWYTSVLDDPQVTLPWWLRIVLRLTPSVWFHAKLNGWLPGVGATYRWFLKQPYLAPHDPGTFLGFAERLTKGRNESEDPEQLALLLTNAFLADLRAAYRRVPRFLRAGRRTTYPVALLDGITRWNGGYRLLKLVNDIRNQTGLFDPLLVVSGSKLVPPGAEPADDPGSRIYPPELAEGGYRTWCRELTTTSRSPEDKPVAWYLAVEVPPSPAAADKARTGARQALQAAAPLTAPAPFWLFRRGLLVSLLSVLLVAGGAAGATYVIAADQRWRDAHCGLTKDHQDAHTLVTFDGQCVGVSASGFAFTPDDAAMRRVQETIGRQNAEVLRLHEENRHRPYLTLAYLAPLSSTANPPDALVAQRESLAGIAVGQRRQLDKNGADDPLVRVLVVNTGELMNAAPRVIAMLGEMAEADRSIVGVVGLEQSRVQTLDAIEALTLVGLPIVAPALSADVLPRHSPLYYQVSPQNQRQAAVAAAYAKTLVERQSIAPRVRILHSADEGDIYSTNLRDDARAAFAAPGIGFTVEVLPYEPAGTRSRPPGTRSIRALGQEACDYDGLVFFSGRPEDFAKLLNTFNEHCQATSPAILAGDDVSRYVADPGRRGRYPAIEFDYLSFAVGSAHCDPASDLYSTLRRLFPAECEDGRDPSLDGHAALAYDALLCYVRAAEHLADTGRGIPITPGAIWHELTGIHGPAALDGASGKIDFGGEVNRQVPKDKNVAVLRVSGAGRPTERGACGRHGDRDPSEWCPQDN